MMKKMLYILNLIFILIFSVNVEAATWELVGGNTPNVLNKIDNTATIIVFNDTTKTGITHDNPINTSGDVRFYKIDNTLYIDFEGTLYLNEDSSNIFLMLKNLEKIEGLEYTSISNVKNMSLMFYGTDKIESIDLSCWDTSNVTNISSLFMNCTGLKEVNLSTWDTTNLTTVYGLFAGCRSLTNIDVSNINVSKCGSLAAIFRDCTSLTTIDLSTWDSRANTNLFSIFQGCTNLKTIYVGTNWDISKVKTFGNIFTNCINLVGKVNYDSTKVGLEYANIDGYLTLKEVTIKNLYDYTTATGSVIASKTGYLELTSSILDSSYTFVGNLDSNNKGEAKLYIKGNNIYISSPCKMYLPEDSKNYFRGLKINSIIGADLLDTSKVTSMENLFYGDTNIIELDLSSWDTSNVTTFKYAFSNNTKLQNINLSDWNLEKAINLDFMFMECVKLHEINVANWDVSNIESWLGTFYKCVSLTTLDTSNWVLTNTKDMTGTFYCCVLLTELDTSKWKFGKVEKLYALFQECNKLEYVDVSNWDVSNCNNLCYLFCRCYALKSIDVSKWDVSKVTAIQSIFFYCSSLTEIDVSNWDTSNVTNMHAVFSYCIGLTKLDLSTWNTSKVTVFTNMFLWCENLEELDVSSFVASSECSSVASMFANCKKIKKLDLSNFNVSEACTYNDKMFNGCESLESIFTTGDWHFGEIQVYGENGTTFFNNCLNLVGAIAYDPEKISYEYANTDTYFINYHVYSNTYKVDENTITYTGTFDINKLTYKTVTVKKEGNKLNVYKGDEVIKTYSLIEKVVKQEPKKEIIKEDIIIKSNNNKINNLSIGYELIKIDDNNYKAIVENNIKTITIRASLEDEKATINGLGTKNLLVGDNKFELTVIAENGDINTINIFVNRKDLYYIETIDEALEQEDNKIEVTIKEETILDKETINKIIESNKEVEIKFQEEDKVIYSWTFDNSKLDNIDSINTKITFETNNEKINDFNINNGLVINIENKEKLPENTKLKVYVGDNFNKNEKVKIYSYDKENNEMILLDETILADEYIEIELGDSLEFLVIKDEEVIENKSNKILYIIISIIIIIGMILIIKKTKKD